MKEKEEWILILKRKPMDRINRIIRIMRPSAERPIHPPMELQAHGLVKKYKGRAVVNHVDVSVAPGEIVGLAIGSAGIMVVEDDA